MPNMIKIDANHPDPEAVAAAAAVLREGGVIAYPTETFYALGADSLNEEAIARIFRIKGRTFNNPIALIGSGRNDLSLISDEVPVSANPLIEAFWPGPLTLIFKASQRIPTRLTAGTGKIGIRIPGLPLAQELAAALGRPITATSANRTGSRECVTAAEVLEQIGTDLDAIIDGGKTPGGLGSTMLDVTAIPPAVLRQGAIAKDRILQVLA